MNQVLGASASGRRMSQLRANPSAQGQDSLESMRKLSLAEQRRTQRIFEMVMVAIASISLLVGGIGIMNIMLASVMERTREIGVRRAIGAKKRDVIRQFLIETTIISLAGGVLGVMVGVGLSQMIGYFAGWSTIVTTTSIVLAFVVSVAIGLVFGLYPAVRAASLDPVKALHYE